MSFYKDNEDLRYYVDHAIDWKRLFEVTERRENDPSAFKDTTEAVEFYREVMEMVGDFVAREIAPHAGHLDQAGVKLVDGEVVFPDRMKKIFDQIRDLELHGLTVPRELGGMNVPLLVYFLNSEMMGRADVSVMAHHGFHGGMAMALLVFSLREGTTTWSVDAEITDTRFRDAIAEIVQGESWGCMDITEPDAGSDMAALRMRAELESERWYLSGEKIFITSGHGKWHFVIARTEEAADPNDPMAGLAGLSFFLAKAYEDHADGSRERFITITRVEEKMGHHGSATCGLLFDRTPAVLLGKRGEGFRQMLMLMNNARVGVGFECLGLCEASLRKAKAYAGERKSMGKTIDHHEMIADMLDEMEADVVALRALAVTAAEHEEIAQKLQLVVDAAHGTPEIEREIAKRKRASRRLTPLLKYFGAEKAVEIARRGLQIHGGNGYIREYGAEKLVRDAMVMPIYEGTSQIQSLMAMKDSLQAIMNDPRRFVTRSAQARWRGLSSRDPLERRVAKLQQVSFAAQRHLVVRTAGDKARGLQGKKLSEWPERFLKNWDPKRDFAYAMLHAERLTKILTDVAVAELLLEQTRRHPWRHGHLERHLERAELRCESLLREITTSGDRLLRTLGRVSAAPKADAAE